MVYDEFTHPWGSSSASPVRVKCLLDGPAPWNGAIKHPPSSCEIALYPHGNLKKLTQFYRLLGVIFLEWFDQRSWNLSVVSGCFRWPIDLWRQRVGLRTIQWYLVFVCETSLVGISCVCGIPCVHQLMESNLVPLGMHALCRTYTCCGTFIRPPAGRRWGRTYPIPDNTCLANSPTHPSAMLISTPDFFNTKLGKFSPSIDLNLGSARANTLENQSLHYQPHTNPNVPVSTWSTTILKSNIP